ncbi:uncharacterized protein LOC143343311 isoform X1 [Colletes latitarsis]|uniref:uncharacterized protein LOC143343311 isoform X1 n=2 Tax=Colletes latitarsis TaxID=2605962 RepID=UPI00403642F9
MSISIIIPLNNLAYHYFPTTKSRLNVSIQAAHDARICLRTHLGSDSNMYEIIFGGWGNTMSAIRRNGQNPNVAEAETKDILHSEHVCPFWIKWTCDGCLSVGHQNEESFMSFKDKNPFALNYIGVNTAWDTTGEFFIEESKHTAVVSRHHLANTCHYWVDYNESLGFPQNAAVASEDGLYIGRTHHRDSVTPGGIRNNICTIVWGGASYNKKQFQVLCVKNISWVRSWGGSIPLNALPAGETEDGYDLYIGRVLYEGVYYIGKIQPNHQVCYIPVDGQEEPCLVYEALVICDTYVAEYVER